MPDRPDPLTLDDQALRALGHAVVDIVADHWAEQRKPAPVRVSAPEDLRERLARPAPEEGADPQEVLAEVLEHVLPHVQHGDHPRFFARIPGPSNPVGAVADFLAAGLNVFAGSWTGGSGPAALELVVLDWLRDLCGLPEGAEGAFVTGGSVATLDALAAAREHAQPAAGGAPLVAYLSDQAHAAVARALRVLGFDERQVRVLPTGADLRLDPAAVASAVAEDRAAGRRPFCVVATAGTTNTGAVDPLEGLAGLCREHDLWLHVDAAYGGPALLTEAGRALLRGIEHADSIAIDPHKWLFQPYECGVLLVRRRGALARAFSLHPEYLADVAGTGGQVNFFDRGVQLTRGFRALKLWMTVHTFGMAALREGIQRGMDLAEEAERMLRARGWRIVTPAQLAIVSFRRAEPGLDDAASDARHAQLVGALQRDGTAAVSSTVLRGRTVLRLCTINPRTTREDLRVTLDALERCWAAP